MHRFIDKRTGIKINNTFDNINLNGKHVYVLQDGYEIRYLKKYLSGFQYLNPVTKLRQNIAMERPIDMLGISIDNILKSFNFIDCGKLNIIYLEYRFIIEFILLLT